MLPLQSVPCASLKCARAPLAAAARLPMKVAGAASTMKSA